MATIGRENVDASHVTRYDDISDADAAAEVRLLRAEGLDRDSTVVDIGAGTGQFALAAAEVSRRVVAVDPSPVMLSVLEEKARTRSVQLVAVRAGFLTYEHSGAAPDFVYSRWALHHLPDFWKVIALRRVARMLRPGGTFRLSDVVYNFEPDETEERIESWCASLPSEGDGWIRADIEEHVRDEHSTYTWLLEQMFDRTGFEVQDASYSDDGIFAKYLLTRTRGHPSDEGCNFQR